MTFVLSPSRIQIIGDDADVGGMWSGFGSLAVHFREQQSHNTREQRQVRNYEPVSFHPMMRLTCSKIRVCRALSPTLNGSHRLPNRHVSIVWRPDGFLRADKCRREGSLSCSSPLRMGDVDVVVHNEHTCNGKGVTDTHS